MGLLFDDDEDIAKEIYEKGLSQGSSLFFRDYDNEKLADKYNGQRGFWDSDISVRDAERYNDIIDREKYRWDMERREEEEKYREEQREQEIMQMELEEERLRQEEEAQRREERELSIAGSILAKHGIDINELEEEKHFYVYFYNHTKKIDKEVLYVLRRLLNLSEEDSFCGVYPPALHKAFLLARDYKKEVGKLFDEADIYNYLAMNPLHWDKEVKGYVRKTSINIGNGLSISNDFFSNYPINDGDVLNCVYENIRKGVKKTVCNIAGGRNENFVTSGRARVSAIVPCFITMILTFFSTFVFLNKYSFVAALVAGLLSFLCYKKEYVLDIETKVPCYKVDEIEPYIIGQQSSEYKQYIAYAAIANIKFSRFLDNVLKAYNQGLAEGEKEYASYVEKKSIKVEHQKDEYISSLKKINKEVAIHDMKDALLSIGTVVVFSIIFSVLSKTLF